MHGVFVLVQGWKRGETVFGRDRPNPGGALRRLPRLVLVLGLMLVLVSAVLFRFGRRLLLRRSIVMLVVAAR
ncbi:MAG: hypothetical protein AB7N65_04925 [Vicinamibacterales bacterium]